MTGTADTSAPSLGVLLRQYREAAGLSQEELAERAGLTRQAIGALERGERRHPYPGTMRRLADALNLSDEARATFLARIPSHVTEPSAEGVIVTPGPPGTDEITASPPSFMLPTALTPLLGREEDVAHACDLLDQGARLLTLTGPGGVGKTRLALEIATAMRPHFADGVAFVSLAQLADARLVLPTVAHVLGVQESPGRPLAELLHLYLHDKRLLLVLDNCEHVLQGATEVVPLLESCPKLVVLATSRAPLRVRGEREYAVFPLALPDFDHAVTREEALRSPAVQLFVERAQAVRREFTLGEQNASTVAAICGRLDGLPLALELAAPRLKLLPPSALLARLHHALPLLTGGGRDAPSRQQTLRDTIAWSYGLLGEGEQALFRGLSVFAGGCTLEAAEAVCATLEDGEAIDVLEGLESLVEKSLLHVHVQDEGRAEPRFTMLETIREFAREELEARGEATAIRERHAHYFLDLTEVSPEPLQPLPDGYLVKLETEQDNLRAAMDWAMEQRQVALGMRLVCALNTFWVVRGRCGEGQRWADDLLAIEGDVDPRLRSRALVVAATMARLRGDFGRAVRLGEEALALARETGASIFIAFACQQLGAAAGLAGDPMRAASLLEEGLALSREAKSPGGIGVSTLVLGGLALQQGELDRARALLEESLALWRELGDRARVALLLSNLAQVAVRRGELDRVKALLLECLPLAEQEDYRLVIWSFLELMAVVALREGETARAARLLGAAEVARSTAGEALEPEGAALLERTVETGRSQLGEAAWERAYQEGRALPFEEALALARAHATDQHHRGERAGSSVAPQAGPALRELGRS